MKRLFIPFAAAALLLGSCSKEKASLDYVSTDPELDGETIDLVTFGDSTVVATATVTDGHAQFIIDDEASLSLPQLLVVMKDRRTKGYYVAEPGSSTLIDSTYVSSGTPLNEKFARSYAQADSVDQLDDLAMYTDFVKGIYDANKDNPIGEYFAVEYIKYGDPTKIKEMVAEMPTAQKDSKRAARFLRYADLRANTAPGMKYTDFAGEDAQGNAINLSDVVKPGRWTLVDFWASWCRYCIKELPELKNLYEEYNGKGLDIVGVAVRDEVADTKGAVEKFQLPYTIVYNTGRAPYEIYGFSGIPHHMLIAPDGTIASRGENAAQIKARLDAIFNQ